MIDFGALFHAYGPATDTPAHLAALVGDDVASRDAALAHLWSAVIHQGTPWTVTPPVAVHVAGLLGDPRLAGSGKAGLRAALLAFLAAVGAAGRQGEDLERMAAPPGVDIDALLAEAIRRDDEEAIWGDEVLGGALYARAVLGCRAVAPTLVAAAVPALSDPDPAVRTAAAHAASACGAVRPPRADATAPQPADVTARMPGGAPAGAARVPEDVPAAVPDADPAALAGRLTDLAAAAPSPDERAALVLSLGELGAAPRAFLADPHPGVRACAALASALADDPAATAELLAALADPAATDAWFTHRPPQTPTRIRFALVGAAVARVADPARLLPAALAVARIATLHTVDGEWGPLLRALFDAGPAQPLSGPQREYLAALVDRADLWAPWYGNAGLAFTAAGLPYDREACRALLRSA